MDTNWNNHSDVKRLRDLLLLLRLPAPEEEFFQPYGAALGPNFDTRYLREKLTVVNKKLASSHLDSDDVLYVASYCLMFFDVADNPEACEVLACISGIHGLGRAAGARWANSVSEAAWRLFVPLEAGNKRVVRLQRAGSAIP